MKIGVISDTHIPLQEKAIPKEILETLANMDMVIHVGDLVQLNVLDTLKKVCKNVTAVHGNMDLAEVKDILPAKEVIEVGKYKIGITHGSGSPSNIIDTVTEIFKKDKVDIIIFGHSHCPFNEKRGKILYFNPGSLTDKIFAPYNCYGIIEINEDIKAEIIKI